jgi:hypothetical protein
MNWRAHVKHRLALGHHRLRTMARIMTANGSRRKLARKVGWAVAMSTLAYGIKAIWEGQAWLLEGFEKLTTAIGRTVAGTFGIAKGDVAVRAADTPPARPALDPRRERLLASALSAPEGTPKRILLPPKATDDSTCHRIPRWFAEASDNNWLIKEGRQVKISSPRV